MQNPFEIIEKRLLRIEGLLEDLIIEMARTSKPSESSQKFGKIPIQEIFKQKLLSKPTLYSHVKAGTITIYKMGGRSYVDAIEFNNAFKKVKIA